MTKHRGSGNHLQIAKGARNVQKMAIQQAFQDETFVKSLLVLETPEEVQATLSGRGVDMTVDEIKQVRELLVKRMKAGAELTEEELNQVAGGSLVLATTTLAIFLGLSFAVGALAAGGAGSIGAIITHVETKGQW